MLDRDKNKYLTDNELMAYRLMLSLSDQIKTSLVTISKSSEHTDIMDSKNNSVIKNTADYMIDLINAYSFGLLLSIDNSNLEVETVSISAILYNTAKKLEKIAKDYNVKISLDISSKNNLIISNPVGLEMSLISLGISLIESLPSNDDTQLELSLASHNCRYGLVAGIYADNGFISNEALKKGKKLYGLVRQPLTSFSHNSSAGIFIADNILSNLNLRLKTSQHRNLSGLSVVLNPAAQLQFI